VQAKSTGVRESGKPSPPTMTDRQHHNAVPLLYPLSIQQVLGVEADQSPELGGYYFLHTGNITLSAVLATLVRDDHIDVSLDRINPPLTSALYEPVLSWTMPYRRERVTTALKILGPAAVGNPRAKHAHPFSYSIFRPGPP